MTSKKKCLRSLVVEHLLRKQKVSGSIPDEGLTFCFLESSDRSLEWTNWDQGKGSNEKKTDE
jgi:hypothetical protein